MMRKDRLVGVAMSENLGRTIGEYPNLDKIRISGDDARIKVRRAHLMAERQKLVEEWELDK